MNILNKITHCHFIQYHFIQHHLLKNPPHNSSHGSLKSLSMTRLLSLCLLCLGLGLSACDGTQTAGKIDTTDTEQTSTTQTSTTDMTPIEQISNGNGINDASHLADVNEDNLVDTTHISTSQTDDTNTNNTNTNNTNKVGEQITIDWTKVDSGVKPVDPKSYPYVFAKDSSPVKSYADYFGVDRATAQYNLTIGMASNEPLSKLLDQLGTAYETHELIDGNKITLVIYTTDAIAPSSYDYVIADKIGRGLILPIRIVNKKVAVETVE
ncbi:hypothetical protein WDM69_06405 [Moraxella lincolnii]|uniref:hypothetical protein n=1 Tax=Lwoffella lincolnii TaxID=90241 RepID=UPI0030D61173